MKKSKTPQPASSAIIERDGRYLLVLRSNPPSADMYAFPGGRGEPGETPAETALRELFEETGISAEKPLLFATYDLPGREDGPGSPSFRLSVFKVKADATAIAVASDDAAAVGWYTAGEIEKLPAPDSVRECIRRLEAERTGQTA
ncbi:MULTISPECIES: NUDIX hydrolase [Alphaproteobacteria]|jgi:8-oxo-dGTP diphosphatase|uniref:NUDIX hydrolase n=1 Tax=Alphaproteobacteria TaxID=28211 RepID=UPI0003C53D82|nr:MULTISPECIES: NUDIX hydrolase [Alphaproteobacteria]MCA0338495.1 NUDIX hydrolase [Pseudomonadota bacterium]EYR78036.1 putative NUDIX family protein [Shinella sp. DD12]MCO5150538.1 NUDIX hydrolase [Shinella sp.]MDC7261485.1 NUDIX hydrolase [Shinella sp. HY16]MDC7268380.1 NUDIX hydrolase [Shinella sp. YZ44]